jgi:hypothetical protein
LLLLTGLLGLSTSAAAQTFSITRAEWSTSDGGRLRVEGRGTDGRTVTIRNAGNNAVLGTDTVDDDEWSRRFSRLTQVPCTVSAQQSGSTTVVTRAVSRAPSNCGPVVGAPAQPAISVNDVTVTEGATANFTVSLSAASTQTVTVVASTANGSAVAPGDYTARTSVTLNFAPGATTQTFAVTTINDTAVEQTETFNVTLSGATNATIADATGVGTINDNDAAPPPANATFSVNDVTVAEGGTANFTVTRAGNTTTAVSVIASTANGTAAAPGDFTARANVTLNFAAGVTTQTFAVTTLTDTVTEGNETFNVNLSGASAGATISDAQGIGTITNVAPPPPNNATFSINDVTVTEGGTASFTVSRAGTTTTAVSVVASTANDTAVAPGDFTARTNVTLNFAANVTTQAFTVVTTQDTVAEATERFFVNLSGASAGATITDAQGIGTITDNDAAPPPQACNPTANGDHRGCFTNLAGAREYTGPEQCVACHEQQARNMHSSVHYQQNGPTDFVTNIAGDAGEGPAGRPSGVNAVIGINTYCGTHENSPRFTCAGCHVGNGRFPKTEQEFATLNLNNQRLELANIDCLTCHQQVYKRFPDWTATSEGFSDLVLENVALAADGTSLVASAGSSVTRTGFAGIPNVNGITFDFLFRPAGAPGSVIALPAGIPAAFGAMTVTTEVAAETLHRTTRQSCLNCHAGAAGANGAKRGDLSTANIASTDLNLDRHMATNGSNMTCSTCHNVDDTPTVNDTGRPSTHRVRGRGLDLRANDSATRFTCDNAGCHNATTVHNAVTNGTQIARHMTKVACQTCHIPSYGKGVATEIARDWQAPHVTQTACNGRGGWLPNEIKSSTATPPAPVTPTYQWFDGTSQVYYLTEPLTNTPRKPLTAAMATALNMPANTQAYVMGRPNPNPENATTRVTGAGNNAAKIYPMKEHWGKLARNTANNTLVAQSTFEFFRTGSFCRSVAQGLNPNATDAQLDQQCPTQLSPPPAGTEVVAVHTYQTINHGVEPQANSLGANNTCGTCHDVPISPFTTGKPLRMNLQRDMGYAVTRAGLTEGTNGNWSCSPSCHGTQSGNFTNIHSRSQHRNAGCNACHSAITGR